MHFHQMLLLKSYYYYENYNMLGLIEDNARNLEVCTLKVREDCIIVTQNISPTSHFRDDL